MYLAEKYLPLKSLKILRLRTNELYTLDPDVFEHIDQLEELDISKNAFSLLDPNTVTAITSLGLLKVSQHHSPTAQTRTIYIYLRFMQLKCLTCESTGRLLRQRVGSLSDGRPTPL